jgi:hypothetical protein
MMLGQSGLDRSITAKRKIVNKNVSSKFNALSRCEIDEILCFRVVTGFGRDKSSRHTSDVWNHFEYLHKAPTDSDNGNVIEQQQLQPINNGRLYCSYVISY